jgi:hypothetical protein
VRDNDTTARDLVDRFFVFVPHVHEVQISLAGGATLPPARHAALQRLLAAIEDVKALLVLIFRPKGGIISRCRGVLAAKERRTELQALALRIDRAVIDLTLVEASQRGEGGASAYGALDEMRGETQHALAEFERTVLAGQEAAARRVEALLANHAADASTPADLDALADKIAAATALDARAARAQVAEERILLRAKMEDLLDMQRRVPPPPPFHRFPTPTPAPPPLTLQPPCSNSLHSCYFKELAARGQTEGVCPSLL